MCACHHRPIDDVLCSNPRSATQSRQKTGCMFTFGWTPGAYLRTTRGCIPLCCCRDFSKPSPVHASSEEDVGGPGIALLPRGQQWKRKACMTWAPKGISQGGSEKKGLRERSPQRSPEGLRRVSAKVASLRGRSPWKVSGMTSPTSRNGLGWLASNLKNCIDELTHNICAQFVNQNCQSQLLRTILRLPTHVCLLRLWKIGRATSLYILK